MRQAHGRADEEQRHRRGDQSRERHQPGDTQAGINADIAQRRLNAVDLGSQVIRGVFLVLADQLGGAPEALIVRRTWTLTGVMGSSFRGFGGDGPGFLRLAPGRGIRFTYVGFHGSPESLLQPGQMRSAKNGLGK